MAGRVEGFVSSDMLTRANESDPASVELERLQQTIDGTLRERAHRIGGIHRGEDDRRVGRGGDLLKQGKPVEPRKTDVGHDDVGAQVANDVERLVPLLALGDDGTVEQRTRGFAHERARRRVGVGKTHRDRGHDSTRWGRAIDGTRAPTWQREDAEKLALGMNRTLARVVRSG